MLVRQRALDVHGVEEDEDVGSAHRDHVEVAVAVRVHIPDLLRDIFGIAVITVARIYREPVFILIDAMRNDPSDSQSNANKVKMMKILRHVPKALRFSGLHVRG